MANPNGQRFLQDGGPYEIVGIEEMTEPSDWFYPVVKWNDGSFGTFSISRNGTGAGSSVFGHLRYFATICALRAAQIKVLWDVSSNPIWPIWYEKDNDKLERFFEKFSEVVGRYGFTRHSIFESK